MKKLLFILLALTASQAFASSTLDVEAVTSPTLNAQHPIDPANIYTITYTIKGKDSRLTTYDVKLNPTYPAGVSFDNSSTCVLNQRTSIGGQACTLIFKFNPIELNQSLFDAHGNYPLDFGSVSDVYNTPTTLSLAAPSAFDGQIISVKSTPNPEVNSEYTLHICFKTGNETLHHWAFGFYMARTFLKSSTCPATTPGINCNINIDLIPAPNCAAPSTAGQKIVSVSKDMGYSGINMSQGYTSVFIPVDADNKYKSYPLASNTDYMLRITNANQWGPGNLSSMPQSFYFMNNFALAGESVLNFPDPSASQYTIGGYDAAATEAKIEKHVADNWANSQPVTNTGTAGLANQYKLVPTPESITQTSAPTKVAASSNQQIKIYCSPTICSGEQNNDFFAETYIKNYFIQLYGASNVSNVTDEQEANVLLLKQTPAAAEKYQLDVTGGKLTLTSFSQTAPPNGQLKGTFEEDNAALLYGMQTFKQLMFHEHNDFAATTNLNLSIVDKPRFKYRGITLDVARHFYTVPQIKKLLDVMLANKLNTLHLHLSDDEGFRLQMSGNLSGLNKGGLRGFVPDSILQPLMFQQGNLDITNHGLNTWYPHADTGYPDFKTEDTDYPGTYSQADIQSLLTYANERNITVIPEIDLPAHASAIENALPGIFHDSADKSKFISVQGYESGVLPICLYGGSNSFTTGMNQLITDTANEFNNQTTIYAENEVSVGGDEIVAQALSDFPACNTGAFADSHTTAAKAHYFFKLLRDAVNTPTPGIKISGWQETVEDGSGTLGEAGKTLPANETAHIWVWQPAGTDISKGGLLDAKNLVDNDYPTVLAFADHTYFDLTYTPDEHEPGFNWATQFGDTHAALSIVQSINRLPQEHIMGIEGALWGENMNNFNHLIYMALPKMMGLAEAAWSPSATTDSTGKVNWKSLVCRLKGSDGFIQYLQDDYKAQHAGETLNMRSFDTEYPQKGIFCPT